jgi:hypothetical protein
MNALSHLVRRGRALLAGGVPVAGVLLAVGSGPGIASDCTHTSVGLVPITALGTALYKGEPGGLYPGLLNVRPAGHEAAGLAEAAAVEPRDAQGQPDPAHGRIVLLTLGMSNTSLESNALATLAGADPQRNPRVIVINGAQGGQTAALISDPAAGFWTVVDDRLTQRGLTPLQVQAVWLKEANANPTQPFPVHADTLYAQLRRIVRTVRERYPNARLCYCSSRIYAGYATTTLNPEPYAYESAFAVRRLIAAQIGGDLALGFDPTRGPVAAPWLCWGPYLWADGLLPRGDGLTWQCLEFIDDGTHPSALGAQKVAQSLLDFFKTDATAAPWFLAAPTAAPEAPALPPARVSALRVLPARPNPFNPRVVLPLELAAAQRVRVEVLTASGRGVCVVTEGWLAAGAHALSWDGTDAAGRPVASGVYSLRVTADGEPVSTQRVALVR